jgi:F0F1-type ATP synthase assembly protein I
LNLDVPLQGIAKCMKAVNTPENEEPQKDKNIMFNYAKYSTLAIQMVVIILLAVWGGVKLDKWLNLTVPVFTILLSLLGVFAAIYLSVKDLLNKPPK